MKSAAVEPAIYARNYPVTRVKRATLERAAHVQPRVAPTRSRESAPLVPGHRPKHERALLAQPGERSHLARFLLTALGAISRPAATKFAAHVHPASLGPRKPMPPAGHSIVNHQPAEASTSRRETSLEAFKRASHNWPIASSAKPARAARRPQQHRSVSAPGSESAPNGPGMNEAARNVKSPCRAASPVMS